MQTPDAPEPIFVQNALGKTTDHSIAHNVPMKTTNARKFGADDVKRPSKRFTADGLKLSCKKKTSLYKN